MLKYLILSLTLPLLAQFSTAKDAIFHKNGLAISGYDAVAYHQEKAVEGKEKYQHPYMGQNFYFANAKNLNLFSKDPQKYVPLYGGWCAWAMYDEGSFVKSNPNAFKVIKHKDGSTQVLLFYKNFVVDTLEKWNALLKDTAKTDTDLIHIANQHWEKHFTSVEN